jgi:hypothetical protein
MRPETHTIIDISSGWRTAGKLSYNIVFKNIAKTKQFINDMKVNFA